MRIAFLVERPTQFEAPFFRHAAADPEHRLEVFFTAPDGAGAVHDPELGREVSWGIDLLGGYPWETLPDRHRSRWLAERLRPERLDLLIVNGWTRWEYLHATARARRAGVATALRIDTVLWGPSTVRDRAKKILFPTLLGRLFDRFLATGSRTLEALRAFGVPAERTGLFPYAVDVEDFHRRSRLSAEERAAVRERLGVPAEAKVILALAKLNERESPWDLVRAFAGLAGEGLHLVVAGDGPQRAALEGLARSSGIDRARFPGYVPYPELPALYAAADLFVHAPGGEERWGVSVQEALACGLPVVASSRVGAGYDLVEPGENGFLYEAGRPEELTDRLAAALALPPERVRRASEAVLARWDYAASWRHLVEAARNTRKPARR